MPSPDQLYCIQVHLWASHIRRLWNDPFFTKKYPTSLPLGLLIASSTWPLSPRPFMCTYSTLSCRSIGRLILISRNFDRIILAALTHPCVAEHREKVGLTESLTNWLACPRIVNPPEKQNNGGEGSGYQVNYQVENPPKQQHDDDKTVNINVSCWLNIGRDDDIFQFSHQNFVRLNLRQLLKIGAPLGMIKLAPHILTSRIQKGWSCVFNQRILEHSTKRRCKDESNYEPGPQAVAYLIRHWESQFETYLNCTHRN